MRAAIYLRQSKDSQLTGLAIERQRHACERLVEARGWTLAYPPFIDNDISASSGARRPGFEAVLRLADARAIGVIVVYHLDRLTRRLAELEDIIERCERARVSVATVCGDLNLSNDTGRLVGRILASVARGEVERKSARQRLAAEQAARIGAVPTRRGFGFTTAGGHHPQEAPAAVELYSRVLAGMTLVAAARWLNQRGLSTTTGRRWEASGVRKMLLNPRNAGLRTLRRQVVGEGSWQPLVPEEIYRATVERLTNPSRRTNPGNGGRRWLGGGLFRCGKCGAPVRVNYDKNGTRAYMCKAAAHLSRSAGPIDDLVRAVVAARLRRLDLADLLAGETPDLTPLRQQAARLRARRDTVTADYAQGLLTGTQLHTATQQVQAALDEVEQRLADAGRVTRLGWLAAAEDPGGAFLDSDLETSRGVIDELLTVRLLAGRRGRVPFDPATIDIAWKRP